MRFGGLEVGGFPVMQVLQSCVMRAKPRSEDSTLIWPWDSTFHVYVSILHFHSVRIIWSETFISDLLECGVMVYQNLFSKLLVHKLTPTRHSNLFLDRESVSNQHGRLINAVMLVAGVGRVLAN